MFFFLIFDKELFQVLCIISFVPEGPNYSRVFRDVNVVFLSVVFFWCLSDSLALRQERNEFSWSLELPAGTSQSGTSFAVYMSFSPSNRTPTDMFRPFLFYRVFEAALREAVDLFDFPLLARPREPRSLG